MGAIYVAKGFKACTTKELREKVKLACEEAGFESGHQYSGDWGDKLGYGLQITDESLLTEEQAEEYILEHSDKWGPLFAVKVLSPSAQKPFSTLLNKLEEMEIKLTQLEFKANDVCFSHPTSGQMTLRNEILERVKGGKTTLKTCQHCGSKVAIKFLKATKCPVCSTRDFILTETDFRKLETLNGKIESTRTSISEVKKEIDQTRELVKTKTNSINEDWTWYVGGDCPS